MAIITIICVARGRARNATGPIWPAGQLHNRVSIDARSAIVACRASLGDWELDTIIGKGHKQALISLSERRSRLAIFAKIPGQR